MTKDYVQMAKDVSSGIAAVRQGAPEPLKAFGALGAAATAAGALGTKTKELMAVAIGIAVHCDGCIAYHAKLAIRNGATKEEFLETIALAVYMGGGPSAVYGAEALRAYEQIAAASAG